MIYSIFTNSSLELDDGNNFNLGINSYSTEMDFQKCSGGGGSPKKLYIFLKYYFYFY